MMKHSFTLTHTMVDIESRRHGHISVFCIPSIQWNPGLLYVIDMFFRLELCPRMINWIYICIHKEFKIPFLVLYLPQIIWQMYDLFKYLLLQYYQWATRLTIFVIPVNTTSQKRHEKNYTWWNIYILLSIGCFKIIGKHKRNIVRVIFILIETIKLYWLLYIAPVSSFCHFLSFGNVKQ